MEVWVRGVVALVVALSLGAPAGVTAAENGIVEGRLVNGTHGKPAENTEVGLFSAKGQEQQPGRSTKTDAQGRFRFSGLPTGDEYGYVVFSTYGGVEYTSKRIGLSPAKPVQAAEVTIYEPTKDDKHLRVRSSSLVMLEVNKATQNMLMLETHVFENAGKTTFAPSLEVDPNNPTPPQALMKQLLRFSIPPDAGNLQKIGRMSNHEIVQNDKGFATDLPLLPGTNEITFMYELPYRDPSGAYSFERTMPYPTDQFLLLSPAKGPRVDSPDLQQAEKVKLFPEYTVMGASKLSARARMSVSVVGLPVNIHAVRPDNRLLWAGSAGLLLLLLVGALLLWQRTTGRVPEAVGSLESSDAEREKLVRTLAALDARYEAGELERQAYERERDVRKQRLISLLAASPDPG